MLAMSAPRLLVRLATASAALFAHALAVEFEGTFIGGGPNGTNVLNNTCYRINAQAVVKDGNAWLDGGINTFVQFQYQNPVWVLAELDTVISGVNNYTIQTPLNSTWDWKKNITQIAHDKSNNPKTSTTPPVVERGALYSGITGDPRIWLFGGTTSYINTSFVGWQPPTTDQYSLWSLDTETFVWDQYDVFSQGIKFRPSNGANAEAPDDGLAFWLDGQINSGSSIAAQPLGDDHVIFDSGLIVFNFNGPEVTAQNISTQSKMGWPRAGGQMIYVPNFGEQGILVMIGGGNKSSTDLSKDAEGSYIPMSDIWVYDVAAANHTDPTSGFYFQEATADDGNMPLPREDFCVVGVSAPDNSSYTIYAYGGRQGETLYDQIVALSLPSFTWSYVYEGISPRYGHSCAMANKRQIITFGGANNTDLTTSCDWESRGVALYDIPDNNWGSVYFLDDELEPYTLPPNVSKSIGGDATGHATIFTPSKSFSSRALAQVMGRPNDAVAAPSDSRGGVNGSGLSGGAIAGIVIGVLAGVAIIAALLFWFVVRPRRNAKKAHAAALARKGSEDGRLDSEEQSSSSDGGTATTVTHHAEADGREVVAYEKDSTQVRPEMGDTQMAFEMDAQDSEVRAEMPAGVDDTAKTKPGGDMKKPLF